MNDQTSDFQFVTQLDFHDEHSLPVEIDSLAASVGQLTRHEDLAREIKDL